MKKLEDFKNEEVNVKNIYGGKIWKTLNNGNSGCGPEGVDLYNDETGKCYAVLGNQIC